METVEVQDEEAVIRPIVTTPPISRQSRADELRSVSSSPGSGTHISSSTSAVSLGEAIAHRAKQGVESWGQLPMEEDASQLTMASVSRLGQTSSWPEEVHIHHDPIQERLVTVAEDATVQRHEGRACSFTLEFQDSRLSPALPLLPDKSGKLHSLAEDTLFHQTDLEFVALRGSPDISVASERFPMPHQVSDASQICSSKVSKDLPADQSVLLQEHLGLTVASVEEVSCCSLSQHTLSPFSEDGEQDVEHIHGILEEMQVEREPCYGVADQPTDNSDGKDQSSLDTRPQEKPMKKMSQVSSSFRSGDITVPLLRELPQRNANLSSSSSVVSSASATSMNKGSSSRGSTGYKAINPEAAPSPRLKEVTEQKKSEPEEVVGLKLDHSRSSLEWEPSAEQREGPLGVASCSSPTQVKTSRGTAALDTSGRSEVSNITTRASRTQQDDDSDALREQLCAEIERARQSESRPKAQEADSPQAPGQPKPPSSQSATPNTCSLGTHSGRGSTIIEVPTDFDKTEGRLSPGFSFERGHTERELSSSGNQMAVDGSFLGTFSQPVSQSTPGVFSGPPRASVQPPIGKLSPIESNLEVSQPSSSRAVQSSSSKPFLAPTFDISVRNPIGRGTGMGSFRDASLKSTGKIQSLPSLNFMEKVGAWNMTQTSGTTYFDNLALRGFTGVSPKKKAFDAISDSLNRMLSQEGGSKQFVAASAPGPSIHSPRRNLAASFSGTTAFGSDSRGGSFVASPLDRPGNQPTLCADTGEIQPREKPDNDLASPESLCLSGMPKMDPSQREPGQNEQDTGQQSDRTEPAGQQGVVTDKDQSGAGRGSAEELQSTAQLTTRLGLDRFSDVSSNRDLSNTLTCSQDSYHVERRLAASIGAVSSVASLEVDNYVPYWTPSPPSPAKDAELNIEARIPMYLHNLGIDQSPSAILTPFVPRGPIREPEFSPTDLCTLKGSTGTPTKSTQPSEAGSPAKGEFSRCSLLSVGSSVSISLSVDSLQPKMPLSQHAKDRPLNERCLQTAFHPLGPLPQGSPQPPGPDTGHNLSDSADDPTTVRVRELIEKFQSGKVFVTPDSLPSTEARQQQARDSPLEAKPSETSDSSMDPGADSFVGSKTLQEIRKLLGRAESIVSGKSSASSSPPSLRDSDDSLLCLKRKLEGFQDSFVSSTGNQEMPSSLLWGRSSSESALTSDGMKERASGELGRSPRASGHNFAQGKGVLLRSLDSISNQAAESFPTKSVRRSEPEGCSATAPDRAAPVFVSIMQVNPPTPSGGVQQGPAQEVMSPTESSVSGPAENMQAPSLREAERAVESDSSSADTLTTRVAALLRNESPATMASSSCSTADEEERKAREWIKLKVTGQQCEKLQLNVEDRQRIEEIKRDLLHNTKRMTKSQLSTDTDSSTHSGAPWGQPPSHAGQFDALKSAEHQLSHQLQRLNHNTFDSSVQLHPPVRQDPEARVRDVAQRTSPPPITSITIASCRRTPSPAPPRSPTPTPLSLAHLATDSVPLPATGVRTSESRGPALQTKEDTAVQISPEAESAGGTVSVAHVRGSPADLVPASGPGPDHPDDRPEPPYPSEAVTQSKTETLGTRYSTSYGFDTSSTAGEGSQTGGGRSRSPFHLNPTSYRQVSRSDPNISSTSSLEPAAAPLHNSTFASGSCAIASPTKKVLSHVHLTLSPKLPKGKSEESAGEPPVRQDWASERRAGGTESTAGLPPDFSTRLTSRNLPEFSAREQLFPDGRPPVNRSSYFPAPRVTGWTDAHQEPRSTPLLLDGASSQGVPIRPIGRENRETADASVQITTHLSQEVPWRAEHVTSFPQSFTAQARVPGLSEPLAIHTPAVPVLLPYKPHGSPELFYIPKSEAPLSDTTVESSHPGSDDAVPPRFSSEVLGSRDREAGAAVSGRHAEGIYSKRPAAYRARPGNGGLRMDTVGGLQTNEVRQSGRPYPLSLRTGDSGDPPRSSEAWPNVRGVDPPSRGQEEEEFVPLQGEETYSTEDLRSYSRSVREPRPLGGSDMEEPAHNWRDFATRGVSSQSSGSNLNELWQRFNERRSQRESGPPGEGETPLLDRLERLSRLIHSSRNATPLGGREASAPGKRREERRRKQGEKEERRREEEEQREADRRRGNGERSVREAWAEPGAEQEEESLSSSTLTEGSFGRHRCPAEKDGSASRSGDTDAGDSASTASTIDTARLIRAFGQGRVQANPGLNRLYSAIGRQREGTEQRRGRKRGGPKPPAPPPAPSETNSTDSSTLSTVAPGEAVLSDGDLPRGPSDVLVAKKAVKLVNKGVQAGDLEIVVNGTRKHTRDVGTVFPSPIPAREAGRSAAGSRAGQGEERSPPKTQSFMNEKRSKKAQIERYPQGVSWFIPADSLKGNAKENQPGPGALPGRGQVWFEPYTKTKPWREPLRERQIQEEPVSIKRRSPGQRIGSAETDTGGKAPPALARITLQEALEMRRPDFLSRSRERVKRLELQVEERRLQAVFQQEREQLFNRPGGRGQLSQPADFSAHRKRVVPRKEMFKRSKQIYSQLPEVQQRIEEEKRKAEYRSYRLNAQLYKKKITNHILGRKTPWQ